MNNIRCRHPEGTRFAQKSHWSVRAEAWNLNGSLDREPAGPLVKQRLAASPGSPTLDRVLELILWPFYSCEELLAAEKARKNQHSGEKKKNTGTPRGVQSPRPDWLGFSSSLCVIGCSHKDAAGAQNPARSSLASALWAGPESPARGWGAGRCWDLLRPAVSAVVRIATSDFSDT